MEVDSQTKEKVQKMLNRLSKPAWCIGSPERLLRGTSNQVDTFNIYWQLAGRPVIITPADFLVKRWNNIARLVKQDWKGHPVGSYAGIMDPIPFYDEVVKPWTILQLRTIAPQEEWERKFYAYSG